MIPKIIHYCWFGRGEKPALAKKCISSWKKTCPDYKIIEWNEDNFDISMHPYLKFCYENKKWAFLSDMARLIIVEKEGGIYFDTDVELLKPIDEFLKYKAFYGFENSNHIATGLGFGAEAHDPTIKAMVEQYNHLEVDEKGEYPLINCPVLNTEALLQFGLVLNGTRQNVHGAEILPIDFLNPYESNTGRLNKTENTISVHWYSKSWMNKSAILRSTLTKPFHRLFGEDCFKWLKRGKGN